MILLIWISTLIITINSFWECIAQPTKNNNTDKPDKTGKTDKTVKTDTTDKANIFLHSFIQMHMRKETYQ